MGVKNSPSFAQAIMSKVLKSFHEVEVFIDDIAIFTTQTFNLHCDTLSKVLHTIQLSGFSIKPKKCFWAVKECEYLGHIITTKGVRPQPAKVDAILRLQPPTTPKQLRSFIGMINYYKDHIQQRSHILSPLSAQSKNKKTIDWTPECDSAFKKLKLLLSQQASLAFPNPNLPFIIEPDASDYQLDSAIL